MKVIRFAVSLPEDLLETFDKIISKKNYPSRSEAIRDLIRANFIEQEWTEGNKEVIGTISIVYDHDTRELLDKLMDFQHHHHSFIISSTHIHLDNHNCLEVIIVKGKGKDIKDMADKLISIRGVKHGKLSTTSTGKELS
ncbi:MAG: nickel-responsive transcriptional regulator NikR [bacterium]|nr:nickel-responsive transcriptional regulator NikR [bacterium]